MIYEVSFSQRQHFLQNKYINNSNAIINLQLITLSTYIWPNYITTIPNLNGKNEVILIRRKTPKITKTGIPSLPYIYE